jgi:hypothetical protein
MKDDVAAARSCLNLIFDSEVSPKDLGALGFERRVVTAGEGANSVPPSEQLTDDRTA